MGNLHSPVASVLEEKVLHFFSPNGLLTVVFLILLMALLFGGTGIENRAMDIQAADPLQARISPLLHTVR